jgi:hypothetical protein
MSLAVVKSVVKCLDKSFHGLRLSRRGDMAIAFQHPQARPSAQLLHSSQVDSAGNESRGECVAGGVRGHIVETGAGTGRLKPGAKRSIGDTRSGCKDEFTRGLSFQARQRGMNGGIARHGACLSVLGVAGLHAELAA